MSFLGGKKISKNFELEKFDIDFSVNTNRPTNNEPNGMRNFNGSGAGQKCFMYAGYKELLI